MTQRLKKRIALDSQQFIDFVNLAYHQAVAARLLADPDAVLTRARNNLQRWAKAHQGTGSAAALAEWQTILDTSTIPELVAIITEDSDEGQRLRQSTPFTGLFTEDERKELWNRCAETVLA
ncbi:MAG TPA: hypothetical protein VFZ34_06185 [Blastocatellia bacterium]|nr:hypothetical protein [Blastocatellia bacterium]